MAVVEVVLLENNKLGPIGSVISVKSGYARNYLVPNNMALYATARNIEIFEQRRKEIEHENAEKLAKAEALANNIAESYKILRACGEDGKLFGSVTRRDIAGAINDSSELTIDHVHIILNQSIKYTGTYDIKIKLHPELIKSFVLSVERNIELK